MGELMEIAYIGMAAAVGIAIMKLGFGIIAAWQLPIISMIAQAFTEALSVV